MQVRVDVLLSGSTGRMLCESFGDVQLMADHLFGESTFTHMFASKAIFDRLRRGIGEKFPWSVDEHLLDDYPDLDQVENKGAAIHNWLERFIYPVYGRTVELEQEPNPVHIPFETGLENLGRNA